MAIAFECMSIENNSPPRSRFVQRVRELQGFVFFAVRSIQVQDVDVDDDDVKQKMHLDLARTRIE